MRLELSGCKGDAARVSESWVPSRIVGPERGNVFRSDASILFDNRRFPGPEWCGLWFAPAWSVDSAVRWRCNGAGGLRKIVVRLRLFDSWFSAVLQFKELREPHGGSPLRPLPDCYSAGCVRSVQKERTLFKFASFASVGAGVVFVPKPAGRVFASLRMAGLRLARLKPDFFVNRTRSN